MTTMIEAIQMLFENPIPALLFPTLAFYTLRGLAQLVAEREATIPGVGRERFETTELREAA